MTGQDSLRTVRRAHEALVIDHVTRQGPLSRQELIVATGLSRTTLLALVTELLDRDVLTEIRVEGDQPRRGRPLHRIGLNPRAGVWVALEVTTTEVRVAYANAAHEIVALGHAPVAANATRATRTRAAVRLLESVRGEQGLAAGGLRGVALAVTGPARSADPRAADRDAKALARQLERQYDAPVLIENNTRLAAYAEATSGAARGQANVLYVTLDDTLSLGIVAGGRLVGGANGLAGEIGHVSVDPKGPQCECGRRGCLDCYLRRAALLSAAEAAGRPIDPAQELWPQLESDRVLRRAFSAALDRLVEVLVPLVTVLDPGAVVLGGGLGEAEELALKPIRAAVEAGALTVLPRPPAVLAAEFHSSAAVRGGLALLLHSRFDPDRLEGMITRAAADSAAESVT